MESKKILITAIAIILLVSSSIILITRNYTPKNIDCRVGDFDVFSTCTQPCGGGTKTRNRTVVVSPEGEGAACPSLEETVECNTQVCPPSVDCEVNEYPPEFGPCTRPCGGGTMTRNRAVVVFPTGLGKACPSLTETVECNTQPCPPSVDCEVGEFTEFSPCSRECGGGFKTRTREVSAPPTGEGAACPNLTETVGCGTDECSTLRITPSSTVSLFSDISCNLNEGSQQFSTITREIGTLTVNGGGNVGVIQSLGFDANITSTGIEPYMIFGLFIKRHIDATVTKFASSRFIDLYGGVEVVADPVSLSFSNVRDQQFLTFLTGDVIGVYIQGCELGAQYGLDTISINIEYASLQ